MQPLMIRPSKFQTARFALILAMLSTVSGSAEESALAHSLAGAHSAAAQTTSSISACDSGVVYDDGTYESSLLFQTNVTHGRAMMLLEPNGRQRLETVCVCWRRSGGPEDPLVYDLGVWASDGPNGAPGTLLGEVTGRQSGFVPLGFPGNAVHSATHDLSVLGLVTDQPVYVGPTWPTANATNYGLCLDTSQTTPLQPGFGQTESATGWSPPEELSNFFGYRAFGIRAVFGDAGPLTACEPDSDTLCLNANRFSVDVDWETGTASGRGQARVISGVDFSGLFWFFNPSNLELLVKVIDGCPVNGHYWVFWAGTTNVGFELRVVDVTRNLERVYTNPLGTTARPTQDTLAFPCPVD